MKTKHKFYVWVLPLIWSCCALLSWQWPGDEYGLFVKSSMTGIWGYLALHFIAPHLNDPNQFPTNILFPFSIIFSGAIVMAAIGYILDLLRVRRLFWVISFAAAAITMLVASLRGYPSVHDAIARNGSLWAYVFYSINMGLYLSLPLALFMRGMARIFSRRP